MAKFDLKTFNPDVFAKYMGAIPDLRKNELLKSGALQPNASIRHIFSGDGVGTYYGTIPFFGLLEGKPDNYDGKTDISKHNTTTYQRSVVCVGRGIGFSEKDFAVDITGGVDFMGEVARQLSRYWENVDQEMMQDILSGVFSMTDTKSADFVSEHTTTIQGNMTPTTLNSAIQKASGDAKGRFTMAIMHSAVATNLENMNCLEFLKQTDANGVQRNLTMAQWNGRTVLVDDSVPFDYVTGMYTTYLLGTGAFDYENVGAAVPVEMSRDAFSNGGETCLTTRQRKVFAPYGISYTAASAASHSPMPEELKDGVNWKLCSEGTGSASEKVINHRAIPIARILSEG